MTIQQLSSAGDCGVRFCLTLGAADRDARDYVPELGKAGGYVEDTPSQTLRPVEAIARSTRPSSMPMPYGMNSYAPDPHAPHAAAERRAATAAALLGPRPWSAARRRVRRLPRARPMSAWGGGASVPARRAAAAVGLRLRGRCARQVARRQRGRVRARVLRSARRGARAGHPDVQQRRARHVRAVRVAGRPAKSRSPLRGGHRPLCRRAKSPPRPRPPAGCGDRDGDAFRSSEGRATAAQRHPAPERARGARRDRAAAGGERRAPAGSAHAPRQGHRGGRGRSREQRAVLRFRGGPDLRAGAYTLLLTIVDDAG